jgi:uncharacterized flavoprotein (TIGR03862 family)
MTAAERFVTPTVAVVGGGPAGMRAAEVLAGAGCAVDLYEHKASVGRKFLVAGRGGLNLTHSEPLEAFVQRYESELPRWHDLLQAFGPDDVRAWADKLDIETYVGSSRRVFPRGQHTAALLRRWVQHLRGLGVVLHTGYRLEDLAPPAGAGGWHLQMREVSGGGLRQVTAGAVILALGGASWPETGSDGTWPAMLRDLGVRIAPWQPSNCGYEAGWAPALLAAAEGLPLKNITLRADGRMVAGELLITAYGLEGGALYQLTRQLRAMPSPWVEIDLKADLTAEQLLTRLGRGAASWDDLARAWKLSPAARALLEFQSGANLAEAEQLVAIAKAMRLPLGSPRPIAEAISSAGGVEWSELTAGLMIRRQPGLFVAGEMIDWEAPTGGYLLQGCFATGTRAAEGVSRYLASAPAPGDSPVGALPGTQVT